MLSHAAWLRPTAGPPSSCFMTCWSFVVRAAHTVLVRLLLFVDGRSPFFLSCSGLSATCCHGCFCLHSYRDEALDSDHSLLKLSSSSAQSAYFPRCTAFLSFSTTVLSLASCLLHLGTYALGAEGGVVGANFFLSELSKGGKRRSSRALQPESAVHRALGFAHAFTCCLA